MSTIKPDYFLTLFEEFKKVAPPKIQAYLDIATTRVAPAVWGANASYATALLAAHMLAHSGTQGNGGSGGALTQEAVGDLSRAYATVGVPGSGDQELLTTGYGQQFVALRRETIVTAMIRKPPIRPGRC